MMVTEEPHGLNWINNVNIAAFGPLVTQLLWAFGSVILTVKDYQLLGGTDLQRESGIFLAGILVGAWTGKTIAGVADSHLKRSKDLDYVKAKTEAQGAVTAKAERKTQEHNVQQIKLDAAEVAIRKEQ